VVTASVEPFTIVAGNPARLVRPRGTTEITHRVRDVPPFA
jgi:acetyltransferase-like isoleucine patch superfamily enzyme